MAKLFRVLISFMVLGSTVISVYGVYPGIDVDLTREFKGPPKCGDKVDYELPGDHHDGILIRGFIEATPGQTVQITSDALLVDGKIALTWQLKDSKRVSGPLRIPEGHVFIIAEKNAGKRDSVYCGPLPINKIKKAVTTVVLP